MIIVNVDVIMLGQTLACELIGDEQRMLLWDAERKVLLDRNKTGAENGLLSGSHLILV